MVYHIFNYRIQNTWYRDSVPCSDGVFDAVMEKLAWKLPANMRVYHYGSPGPQYYPMDNPIMLRRPILSLCPMELVTNGASGSAALYDRQRQQRFPVCSRLGRFVLCHDMDGWPHFYYADGRRFRLAADMQIVPLAFSEAREFVDRYHRHSAAPQGHKFSIGLAAAGVEGYIGIAIASIPKARALNDGLTLEINRVCCDPAYDNACSKLYSAAVKAGKAMGYRRFITYTLPEESGSSIKAVGFRYDGSTEAKPTGWDCRGRPRAQPLRYPAGPKCRWVLDAT